MSGGRSRVHLTVFVASFVTLLGAAGFRSAPSVLMDPLRDEFGWSRATVGFAVSINVLLFGFAGPFAAALQGRFGLKRVTVCALATIATGALLTTQMTQAWHLFLLWGVVVGAGSGCMATVFASTVATRWFVRRRGLVTGALTAATASGQLVFLPLLTRLADGPGWRWVGVTIGLSALAVIPVVLLLLHDRPEDVGVTAYGAPEGHRSPPPVERPVATAFVTLRDVSTDRTFWWLWGSFFVCGLSTTGLVQTHFISAAHDHGITATTAGAYLALIGVFDVIGTVGSGVLTDRYDPRLLLVAYYALRGLSLFVLDPALGAGGGGLVGFMVFYGLDWVATVPPTIAICLAAYGPNRGPVVYGWVFAGHQVGGAVAAFGAGALADATGGYRTAFVLAGVACLVAAGGVLRIPGDRVRRPAVAPTLAPA